MLLAIVWSICGLCSIAGFIRNNKDADSPLQLAFITSVCVGILYGLMHHP